MLLAIWTETAIPRQTTCGVDVLRSNLFGDNSSYFLRTAVYALFRAFEHLYRTENSS